MSEIVKVHTGNATAFDETIRQLPGVQARVIDGTWDEASHTCLVRVEGDGGFFRFAVQSQGYGEIAEGWTD